MEAINFPKINRNLLENGHNSLRLFQEYKSKSGKKKKQKKNYFIKNCDKEIYLR